MEVVLHHGDCIEYMQSLESNSVDSIVTDPPYGLGFMGKKWDDLPPGLPWAQECLRVLKPGGHLLAFGGTRTWHRLASAVEDAGFEIRDSIAWLYGSGFPKSLDVSKAIDKAAGAEHPDAERWQGWGTALKPAFEPIVVGRKPLAEKTVAANVLAHGTGALNIDATRIGLADGEDEAKLSARSGGSRGIRPDGYVGGSMPGGLPPGWDASKGRWPANVIIDESQAEVLDEQAPDTGGSGKASGPSLTGESTSVARGKFNGVEDTPFYGDLGGASRFFYVAKASKKERPRVEDFSHPTVKPLALMRWLVRLVTPPGGTVLEPFAGSGATVEACLIEGFRCIAIEREADYMPLIHQRLERHGYASAVVKGQEMS